MNYRDLDLNLLIALHALLDTRSVSRAAEVLHIGQPACSAALARLRDHFGDELLVPVNRRMVPTPLALRLERQVRESLERAHSITARRPGFDPEVATQRFSIICSDMVTRLVMPHVLRELVGRAPNVSLMFHATAILRSPRMPVEEALDRRNADLLVLPIRYIAANQDRLPLFSSDYSCVAWRGNTRIGDTLTADLFYSLKHVAGTFGDGRVASTENIDSADARQWRKFAVKSEYYLGVPAMVRGTQHIATIPTLLARALAKQHDLRVFPTPIPFPPLTEVLVWPRHLDDDPANIWLRNLISESAARHLQADSALSAVEQA